MCKMFRVFVRMRHIKIILDNNLEINRVHTNYNQGMSILWGEGAGRDCLAYNQ